MKIYDFHSTELVLEQKVFLYNKITKIKIFDYGNYRKLEKIVILIGENKISYFNWISDFKNKLKNKDDSTEKISIKNLLLEIKVEYNSISNKATIQALNGILEKTNNKLFSLLNKDKNNSLIAEKINKLCNNDMILDCLFIPEKNLVALGTVNNYVLLYKADFDQNQILKLSYITKFFCPEKCIVYAISLIKLENYSMFSNYNSENQINILIASGTVFRKIVYWKITIKFTIKIIYKEKSEEIDLDNSAAYKILDLKGHEGVVFNLKIINPLKIISVSDDRTCKIWDLNSNNNTEFSPDNYAFESLIDHNARVWNFIYDPDLNLLATVSEDNSTKIYKENFLTNVNKEEIAKSFKLVKTLVGHIGKNIRTVNLKGNFIFTSAEDGQIIKWNLKDLFVQEKSENKINESKIATYNKNNNNILNSLNFSHSLSKEDSQFFLARKSQNNFSSCVKCLKIIDLALLAKNSAATLSTTETLKDQNLSHQSDNYLTDKPNGENNYGVLIGSNHGDLIYCKINKDRNILESKKVFSDESCRIIYSILFVFETRTVLIGLADGVLFLIKFDPLADLNSQKFDAKQINVFANRKIRITFLHYQIFEDKKINEKDLKNLNAIFVFSNPIAENVVFLFDEFKENEESFEEKFIEKFNRNEGNYLTINTFVKDKLPTFSAAIKKLKWNEFIMFFGDFNGIVYHTIVKKIGQRLYNYNELKFFMAHEKENVSKMLIQKDKFKLSNFITISNNLLFINLINIKKCFLKLFY